MREVAKTAQLQQRHFWFGLGIILFTAGLIFIIQNTGSLFASLPDITEISDVVEIEEPTIPSLATALTIDVFVNPDGSAMVGGMVGGKPSQRLLQPLPEFDEFKYKLLDKPGNYIDQLIVRVHFPRPLSENTKIKSFAIHGIDQATEKRLDERTLEYTATGIGPEATYTIAAQLPSNSFDWPVWRRALAWLMGLPLVWWLIVAAALPLSTLMVLAIMFWPNLTRRFQRLPDRYPSPFLLSDLPAGGAVSRTYGIEAGGIALPSQLAPAIVGILVHGRVSAREIAATILDLANRGYLSIYDKGQGHFSFGKRRAWQGLQGFEIQLLTQLFTPTSYKSSETDIEETVGASLFSPSIAKVYVSMYDAAAAAGYFHHNPGAIHNRYRFIGLLLFFLGLISFGVVLLLEFEPAAVLFLFASMMTMALIIILASDDVPLLTKTGEKARLEWLAFARYLQDPAALGYVEGSQAYYERFLPYAIVLHSEGSWVNRFRQHPFGRPIWYDSAEQLPLALEDFAHSLYPIIGQVAALFAAAKEPTIE